MIATTPRMDNASPSATRSAVRPPGQELDMVPVLLQCGGGFLGQRASRARDFYSSIIFVRNVCNFFGMMLQRVLLWGFADECGMNCGRTVGHSPCSVGLQI